MPLTLDQAIGQKLLISFAGNVLPDAFGALLRRQPIGGVTLFRHLNAGTPAQTRALTAQLQEAAKAAGLPPLVIAADQEGGQLVGIPGTTPFPGTMALGATRNELLARRYGAALGRELAAVGVNVNYAPSCDVNINPANPVIGVRSFGENPTLVARLAAAVIEGMQDIGVAATAKHFPGHGDTEGDTHHGMVVVPHDQQRIRTIELPPFQAAIRANVQLVMTSHIGVPAFDDEPLPATLSRHLLGDLLRDELGFSGVIISDAMDMGAILQGPGLLVDSLAASAAGVDLFLLSADEAANQLLYDGLVQATRRHLLDPASMLASAERVLGLKRWFAGFEQPELAVVGCEEHYQLAREIAEQSVTLVRDDARILPLRLAPNARVAVIVPQLRDLTPADTSSYERCELADSVRRFHTNVEEYLVASDPTAEDIAALRATLAGADLVIVGTVNAFAQTGQANLVNALLADLLPTVAVALRMPYDLASYPAAPTFACTYSVQRPSVDALAAALWGEIPFVGRLPVSIPGLYPLGSE